MQLNSLTCPAAMFNRMAEVTKLLFKAARVRVEFTKEGWQQLLRLHPSPMSAFIQTVNIKADLGLYIASEIVKRHRGRLRVESSLGEGSDFILWLPYSNGAEPSENI